MPDGFSFRVSYGETGEAFSSSFELGDAASFRAAIEAVRAAAPGRDEAQVSQLLADELRSRNIDWLAPGMIDVLASAMVADDATITVGECDEPLDPPFEEPGLFGKVLGRVLGHMLGKSDVREMVSEVVTASPVMSRLMHQAPPDPDLYVPEPGQEPVPAQVITDPDLVDRMPWLVERPPLSDLPPRMPRSAMNSFSFEARLSEEDGTVVVRAFDDRIGKLSVADADAYLPHLRSARAAGKTVGAAGTGRITGRRTLRVTVSLGRLPI